MRANKKSLVQCEWCGAFVEYHTISYVSSFINGEQAICSSCADKLQRIINDESED